MAGAFIDVAQQCAPYIPSDIIAAVVSVESNFQPLAIRVNSQHQLAERPRNKAEAIAAATNLIASGEDIDLGLGGVSSRSLQQLGLTVSDAFDACLNLKATGQLLDGYYQVAIRTGAQKTAADSIMLQSYYGRGDASLGKMVGYDLRVLAERERLSTMAQPVAADSDPATSDARQNGENNPRFRPESSDEESADEQSRGPQWDVFRAERKSSVLIFQKRSIGE